MTRCPDIQSMQTLPQPEASQGCSVEVIREGAVSLQNTLRPSAPRLRAHLSVLERQRAESKSHSIAKGVGLLPMKHKSQCTQIVTPQRSQGYKQQCHPPHRPAAEDLPRGAGTSAYRLQVKEQVRLDLGHALPSVGPVTTDTQPKLGKEENRKASSSGSTCDIWGHYTMSG